ncbi:hypothetical protein AGLY_016546 [Aphis glycines]|uniref:MULE transposase domain-containing protein n=1 Tax=Aphis glycines TaxID=307491 RepID=A0A6G0SXF4_APHGL|nr:hypothetical protein AGLY_016546 [Aphis glycines]
MYAEAVSQLNANTKAKMPVENSLKRTIRNYRKKKNPIDPASLEELQILGEWCYTGGPQNKLLLLDDNRLEGNERIIMFATHEGLVNLTKSSRWYMDGNLALAPKLFSQLYVIRVEINNNFTTSVYILLQNKTLATYEVKLTTLLKKCEEQNLYPGPAIVHVDFEHAVITAITHVHIQGCFYHLTQSTYRKEQELGLQTQYREDQNLIEFCGKMDGLAFL